MQSCQLAAPKRLYCVWLCMCYWTDLRLWLCADWNRSPVPLSCGWNLGYYLEGGQLIMTVALKRNKYISFYYFQIPKVSLQVVIYIFSFFFYLSSWKILKNGFFYLQSLSVTGSDISAAAVCCFISQLGPWQRLLFRTWCVFFVYIWLFFGILCCFYIWLLKCTF